MPKPVFYLLIAALSFILASCAVKWSAINFKAVHESANQGNGDYELGKELYPKYSYEGLPEDFTIKRSPDLSLSYADIELVEVRKNPYSPSYLSVYDVTIHLNNEAGERMHAFSVKHLKRRVAIEVDGKIICIGTLAYVVDNELVVMIIKTSSAEIENTFGKVTDKISIKERR